MDKRKLFQQGTLEILVKGLFQGTISVKELITHGDTGIGTVEGLDGEVVILNSEAYQVTSSGGVNVLDKTDMLPFADVHFADFEKYFDIKNVSKAEAETSFLKKFPSENIFGAIKISGKFKNMKTRAVKKQIKPYPTLVETTEDQQEFFIEETDGTVIGYYTPEVFNGASVYGFHLHYLSRDHKFGGHILNFDIINATVQGQPFSDLDIAFPINNLDFLDAKLDSDQAKKDIEKAEK